MVKREIRGAVRRIEPDSLHAARVRQIEADERALGVAEVDALGLGKAVAPVEIDAGANEAGARVEEEGQRPGRARRRGEDEIGIERGGAPTLRVDLTQPKQPGRETAEKALDRDGSRDLEQSLPVGHSSLGSGRRVGNETEHVAVTPRPDRADFGRSFSIAPRRLANAVCRPMATFPAFRAVAAGAGRAD